MSRNEQFLAGLQYQFNNGDTSARLNAFPPGADQATAKPLATMAWRKRSGEIHMIAVDESARRQGVATTLLERARQIASETRGVPRPRHSSDRTDAGEAWARSLGERIPKRHERWGPSMYLDAL